MGKEILRKFFTSKVNESIECQDVALPNLVKIYLVALLVELAYLDRRSYYDPTVKLVDLYMMASAAEGKYERLERYKRIGDTSIIRLGYFPENINRKNVGPAYYRDMGTSAYYTAFVNSKNSLYKELVDSYDVCIDAIHGVKSMSIRNDIVELHEFWNITKSNFAKRRLSQLGFSFKEKLIT